MALPIGPAFVYLRRARSPSS